MATSTRRTYQTGVTAYYSFCAKYGIPSLPASETSLRYFCTHLSSSVSYQTIMVYLAGVRLLHLDHGFPDPSKAAPLLHYLCTAIRRSGMTTSKKRQPITLPLLKTINFLVPIYLHRTNWHTGQPLPWRSMASSEQVNIQHHQHGASILEYICWSRTSLSPLTLLSSAPKLTNLGSQHPCRLAQPARPPALLRQCRNSCQSASVNLPALSLFYSQERMSHAGSCQRWPSPSSVMLVSL